MRAFFLFLCSCSIALADAPAPAGPILSLPLRQRIETAVADGVWHSVAIGRVVAGQTAQLLIGAESSPGGGSARAERYELDTLSAVYTGVLLAQMAVEGRVRLDDPLSKFLPAGVVCADPRLCAIRLVELAEHRSGLPPLPFNLFPNDPADPFVDYSERQLTEFLSSYGLSEPLAATGQSRLESGLLGWALGRANGTDFATALQDRVVRPLQLEHTDATDLDLLPGRHLGIEPTRAFHYQSLTGAAALRSTLSDQLSFLRANLRPGDSALREALLLARQGGEASPRFSLAWQILQVNADGQDWPLRWQRGSGGAHASFIGFRSDRQDGVVVLGQGTADVSQIGLAILLDRDPPQMPRAIRPISTAKLQDYVGLYRLGPDQELVVRAGSEGLRAQSAGQLAMDAYPVGEDQFIYLDLPVHLLFQRDSADHVESVLIHQSAVTLPARRLSAGAPQVSRNPVALAPSQLANAVGLYRVDANTLARVALDTGGLALQFSGGRARRLVAYTLDHYASDDGEVELSVHRDEEGSADGVVLGLFGAELRLPRMSLLGSPAAALPDPLQFGPPPPQTNGAETGPKRQAAVSEF